jgi:spermidine/putrescine-binding protein
LYVAGCGSSSSSSSSKAAASGPVTLNWVTWNDHYLPAQLAAVQKQTGIEARPSLQTDDSDGYLKVKQTGGQYDIVSTDALWAPKFHTDGLTDPFDISSIPASSQLYPSEGVFGFIDGEQIVKASSHKNRFDQFMNAMAQAPWIAQNFLVNGRPLFNEKAYKWLVNHGQKERADLLFYNQPERALKMTLKGPSGNVQAYIDAFNQVFGA